MHDTIITQTVFFVTRLLYCRGYLTAMNLSMLMTTSKLKDMMVSRITVIPKISQRYLSFSGGDLEQITFFVEY